MPFFTIFSTAALEEEEAVATSLSTPEIVLALAAASPAASKVWEDSSAIEQEDWMRCSKEVNGKVRDLKAKSEKQWDMACTVEFNFICVAGDMVMVHFPRKRCLSVSTISSKYFEVCGIQEKEPGIPE
jgi:hypothetical protein